MQYVNLHGHLVSIAAAGSAPAKKPNKAPPSAYHKGWRAAGFGPHHLEQARVAHLSAMAKAAESGRAMLPWDEDRYIRQTKPHPIRPRPYSTEAAADEACNLARRAGWKGCTSIPVSRGR